MAHLDAKLDRNQLAALAHAIQSSPGRFSLILISYDCAVTQHAIMEELASFLRNEQSLAIDVESLGIDSPFTEDIVDRLRARKEEVFLHSVPSYLVVHNFETLFHEQASCEDSRPCTEYIAGLLALNTGRALLRDCFQCPVVFLLRHAHMGALMRCCADLTTWAAYMHSFEIGVTELQRLLADYFRTLEAAMLDGEKTSHLTSFCSRAISNLRQYEPDSRISRDGQNLLRWNRLLQAKIQFIAGNYDGAAASLDDACVAPAALSDSTFPEKERTLNQLIRNRRNHMERANRSITTVAPFFAGRRQETSAIMSRLLSNIARHLVLWGETRCGLTSLMLKSLVPSFRKADYVTAYLANWEQPVGDLFKAIQDATGVRPTRRDLFGYAKSDVAGSGIQLALLLDNFGSFFTTTANAERASILKTLGRLLNDFSLSFKIVFSVHDSELFHMVALEGEVPEILTAINRYRILHLSREDAKEMGREFARTRELELPMEMVDGLVNRIEEGGSVRADEMLAALDLLASSGSESCDRLAEFTRIGMQERWLELALETIGAGEKEFTRLRAIKVLAYLATNAKSGRPVTSQEVSHVLEFHLDEIKKMLKILVAHDLVKRIACSSHTHNDRPATYQLSRPSLADAILALEQTAFPRAKTGTTRFWTLRSK